MGDLLKNTIGVVMNHLVSMGYTVRNVLSLQSIGLRTYLNHQQVLYMYMHVYNLYPNIVHQNEIQCALFERDLLSTYQSRINTNIEPFKDRHG